MKILIVSTSDLLGGAARAAYRLHTALLDIGMDSQMLVHTKSSDNYTVISEKNKIKKNLNKLRPFLDAAPTKFYKNKTKTPFSPALIPFSNIVDEINRINPDIVHLHWICGGMLSIKDLAKIKAKVVWNTQDMWAFTGGCHYDEECGAYKGCCGNCKVLGSSTEHDLSRLIFRIKEKTFAKMHNLTIVGVSKWVSSCAKSSSLFRTKKIATLPNCFDTNLFRPLDKNLVRNMFNIPKDKKIILFGAMNSLADPRKGFEPLSRALNMLELDNVEFVIAGSSKPQAPINLKYPTHYIAPLEDEISLPLMYNVADVMIVPSIQENLANSIIESLSCGVPVVAFDIGGNSDMIEHKKNGYLVKPYSPEDMAAGISWVLQNTSNNMLTQNARTKVLETFDRILVANKYKNLYENIMGITTNDTI